MNQNHFFHFLFLQFFIIISLLTPIELIAQEDLLVRSVAELEIALQKAAPGAVILLDEGSFEGDNITIAAKGKAQKRITIRAKTARKTFFKSPFKIEGEFITISGIDFVENGMLTVKGNACKITNCKWNDSKQGKWIRVLPVSRQIEISHNTFQNKIFSNQNLNRNCQLVQVVVRNKNERHHIHHNLFKNVAKGKTGNGFETLQLITEKNPFDPPPGHCNTIIEDNLFIRCNGEAEIISVKSNGNLIRRNTFRECRGGLVLRHGDDNVAVQNYLLGGNESGSAGIRIQGSGQVVADNYFQDLGSYALGMMDGTPDDLYIRVEQAQILFNSFINCNNTFVIGINHSKHPNGTTPKDCTVEGNIFFSESGGEYFIKLIQNDEPVNWTWKNNIAFGKPVPAFEGIQNINPHLKKSDLYLPTQKTPEVDNISDLKADQFGLLKGEKRTVGAIQFPVESTGNLPLTEDMVGAGADG